MQLCRYKNDLLLYKLEKSKLPKIDWIDLNFQQSCNRREQTFKFFGTKNFRVGGNNYTLAI